MPREQTDVFRMASIANPLPGPLLPGPVDVYDRGRFLITSAVEHTPPDAAVEIGLGVDPAVKLARNTEFREEATGVLRGGLRLHHAIAIDVGTADNLLAANRQLHDAMTRLRIPHRFEEYDGDHTNRIRERIERNVLPFFSKHLAAPANPTSLPAASAATVTPIGATASVQAAAIADDTMAMLTDRSRLPDSERGGGFGDAA